jgi:hypothetical protein
VLWPVLNRYSQHRLAPSKYANVFTIEQFVTALGTIVVSVDIRQECDLAVPLTVPIARKAVGSESVAAILTRCKGPLIRHWLTRAKKTPQLNHLDLSDEERTGHLPRLVDDLVARLDRPRLPNKDSEAIASPAASEHGTLRLTQGYSSGMLIHESRILQVTIFGTLHENLSAIDFNLLLPDVMIIADEVDSQLTQTMDSFTNEASKSAKARLVKPKGISSVRPD